MMDDMDEEETWPMEQPLELESPDGLIFDSVLRLWDESPENPHAVQIELVFGDQVFRATSEDGYFRAFCEIRRQLEPFDLMPRCFAACENVFPSGMIEQMGCANRAFVLTMGQPGRIADLVEIFETSGDVRPVSVERQQQFYERWLKSPRVKE